MLLHVADGTKKSLLFPCPEANADGAPRLDLQRVENPHNFQGNHRAGAVVRCACRRRPGVEMATQHDHLIFQLGISAGNLANGVETMLMVAEIPNIYVHFNANRDVGFQ